MNFIRNFLLPESRIATTTHECRAHGSGLRSTIGRGSERPRLRCQWHINPEGGRLECRWVADSTVTAAEAEISLGSSADDACCSSAAPWRIVHVHTAHSSVMGAGA